jgi:hypothetical protein
MPYKDEDIIFSSSQYIQLSNQKPKINAQMNNINEENNEDEEEEEKTNRNKENSRRNMGLI